MKDGTLSDFIIKEDGVLMFKNQLCVPNEPEIKREILDKAHNSPYAMHSESTKMY